MSRPLLVTGGSGYLGGALLAQASSPVVGTHLRGESVELTRLDVRDADATAALVALLRPTAVVHTAYVQDGPEAWATNVEGSRNVATAAARAGLRLVHVSTDVVFDGLKGSPYDESDEPHPVTDYGRSKLEAERAVLDAHPDALVVRTSLMVGAPEPGRQERGVLAAARGEVPGAVFFDDELRSPLLVADLARALLELAGRPQITGLLHLGGPESLSRYELACRIAAARGLAADRIARGSVADSGLVRPMDCTLDSSLARGLLASPIGPVRP